MPGSEHPEFKGAGAEPGLEIWRIENLKPVPWPKEKYGKFHEGDSYMCLKGVKKPTSATLDYDLFFWLGKDTTHDEKGVAAYKTVELDDSLGGTPVQYRETQEHESQLFLSVFKSLEYLPGGIDSGFKHVEAEVFEPRMLHLKGARSVRSKRVELSVNSMNSGDVFIVDLGETVYQWNGKEASKAEKAKALDVTVSIKDERPKKCDIILVDEGSEPDAFWTAVGGKGKVKTASEGGADKAAEKAAKEEMAIYKISDEGGKMSVTEAGKYPLKKEMLDTNDAFILNTGSELFVWIGKGANKDEKKESMIYAQNFLSENNMPDYTPVTRVMETAETAQFKSLFQGWDMVMPMNFGGGGGGGNVARLKQESIDMGAMHVKQAREEAALAVKEGSESIKVWRIEDFEKVEWPENMYGQFFGGDSFIVLYTYTPMGKNAEEYFIYFWQGRESSTDEKGASALLATQLDDEMGGRPVQVRVVHGKEPLHFVALWKGKMVVHKGGKGSGFKNKESKDTYDDDGVSLFHVRGSGERDTRAMQIEEDSSFLNSGDSFVLLTPETMFCWYGKGSSEDERSIAKTVAENMKGERETKEINEGEEPEEFWTPLGGKKEYAAASLSDVPKEPRLFHMTNNIGVFSVEEVVAFAQDDLEQDDVFLLDTFDEVYLWVGQGANDTEKKEGIKTAQKYVKSAPDGRSEDTPIIKVNQGSEPAMFTCHFLGWDPKQQEVFEDPYEKRQRELREKLAKERGEDPEDEPAKEPEPEKVYVSDGASYPLDQLQKNLVDGIDPSKKESYLSDSDFEATFGMDKASFDKLPKWKRTAAKKKHGLF